MANSNEDQSHTTSSATGTKRRVFVTGAAGMIGSSFCAQYHAQYDLTMMVRQRDDDSAKLESYGRVVQGELSERDQLKSLLQGMDTIVHLAGNPDPSATWGDLLEHNIIGTYNVMVAANSAGCRRVIYASSIHAVSGYPTDVQVKTNEPVNPGDLYGVSKCFGEALGRYMAEHEQLSVIALRIGAFSPPDGARGPGSIRMLDSWISDRDMHQLICRCIDDETLRFAILHGLSDNTFKRLDISDARTLVGYQPVDDGFAINQSTSPLRMAENLQAHNQSRDQKSGIRDDV